jgi:hypothetical protein
VGCISIHALPPVLDLHLVSTPQATLASQEVGFGVNLRILSPSNIEDWLPQFKILEPTRVLGGRGLSGNFGRTFRLRLCTRAGFGGVLQDHRAKKETGTPTRSLSE